MRAREIKRVLKIEQWSQCYLDVSSEASVYMFSALAYLGIFTPRPFSKGRPRVAHGLQVLLGMEDESLLLNHSVVVEPAASLCDTPPEVSCLRYQEIRASLPELILELTSIRPLAETIHRVHPDAYLAS